MRYCLILAFALTSCVPNKQYRLGPASVLLPHEKAPYTLAFVEFDEMGEFWDRAQLDRALHAIEAAKEQGGGQALVAVFVHGWKNNASDQSGNVWGFRSELNDIAASYFSGGNKVPVVGIYIGWRGSVTSAPVVDQLTFYNRRNTAIRIPGDNITETLHRIMRTTKPPGEDTGSICILIGHSFGGMVLERALSQSIVSLIVEEAAEDNAKAAILAHAGEQTRKSLSDAFAAFPEPVFPPADLVVFVNEAAPATEAKQMLDLLKSGMNGRRLAVRDDGIESPLFLSITSTGDTATGLAMPIGQTPSYLTKSMRTYDLNAPGNNYPPGVPKQSTYYLHTTANLDVLQSHRIVREDCAIPNSNPDVFSCFDLSVPAGKPPQRYAIRKKEARWNDTPYWVMQMPVEFVPDHSTIFTREFRQLLFEFLPSSSKKMTVK